MPEMKTLTVGGYTFTIVDAESVKYVPQDPTAAEQAQAQENLNVKNITVMVAPIDGGNRLIFVDANGTHPVDIMDGVSPVVTLERTSDGVLISVTDKNGTTTAEVKDGKDGEGGSGGDADLIGYATEEWVREGYQPKGNYLTEVPEGYAKTGDIPTKPGDIGAQPAGNYALKSEIPSVPVQSVNGKTGAVKLSASDVGARPSDWTPTAQEVGALPSTYTPPNQTAEQVGADPKGTAATAVSQHNTADDAHGDIRLALQAINERLTAFFDSDDQTLDELSEIVAYITSNKSLIDAITTSKVSVLDIVNNLTTNVANKPLSAAQGAVLKGLIDAVSSSLSGYQPKGEYALKSEIPDISGKLDASKLAEAINTALAQAKASGEFDGEDGTSVTVKSVSESTADGGSNVVTFSDGKALTVKNGKTGSPGYTPQKGVDYTDGKTPEKYVDYFTTADQEAIVQQVIAALGTPVFGTVDEDCKITLTGELADGKTYTFAFDNKDGTETVIGTYTKTAAPTYTNVLPLAENADGTLFVGSNGEKGYKSGYRLSSSGAESAEAGRFVTGFIEVTPDQTIYLKNIGWYLDSAATGKCYVHAYNASHARNAD